MRVVGGGPPTVASLEGGALGDDDRRVLRSHTPLEVVEQRLDAPWHLERLLPVVGDLVQREVQQAREGRRRVEDPHRARPVDQVGRPVGSGAGHPQDAVQLVEHLHGRRGVVDAGGQGPLGDVDQLADAELGVLLHRALLAEPEGGTNLVHDAVTRQGAVDDGELLAPVADLPGPGAQLDDGVGSLGRLHEVAVVHPLHDTVTRSGRHDDRRARRRRPGGRRRRAVAPRVVVALLERRERLARDPVDDL